VTENPFYRLAPFIQEYIYRKGWEELRPIQVRTIQAVLDTDHHILITSGTASGKTEAALLPILTQLSIQPATSIGVLYIGPLKALINDQFERMQELLEETNIPVQSWHGDIDQSKKIRFLKQAQGILQITPESLEAMLINRHSELARLFGDLRFVIIDEVHAFIGSDRGRQILCQLQRLARYQTHPVRRIGLSATLGEPELAMAWLAGGTSTPITLIDDKTTQRDIQLGLEYFLISGEDKEDSNQNALATLRYPIDSEEEQTEADPQSLENLIVDERLLYQHIYSMCHRVRKTLVFANQRAEVEQAVVNLRTLAAQENTPDIYHVHHGSISAPLRESAESAMRNSDRPTCVAATVTLELGIDIGQLDQVLQINATHSVSSFVQRLGRSGRRGTPARMFFYSREEESDAKATVGEIIPWDLLQTIAVIQLYVEEKWIEPPRLPQLPFSLLYHQTMSILMAATELPPSQLAQRVLTLAPFAQVTQNHYRILLRHLIDTQHLEQTETGTLIIGLEGEKIVNNYRFYATFEDERSVRVLAQNREIGTISTIPEVDTSIRLAGYTWRVISADAEQKIVNVQRAKGKAKTIWAGGGAEIHTRVLQRIRQVLQEDAMYGYLQPRAQQRLQQARSLARTTGIADDAILPQSPNRYLLLPWCGTKGFSTLARIFEYAKLKIVRTYAPFYFEVSDAPSIEMLPALLHQLAAAVPSPTILVEKLTNYDLQRAKYDCFVPVSLLREAYARDQIDLEEAVSCLQEMIKE
jgi:ATP-dependent Lhr-like helicase